MRGAAVWLICGALVLPRKGHVQAEGNATLLRALEGAVSFRGLGVKRRKSDEAVSWDRKRGEAKFQAAILPTQPPAVGDPASPLSPHGAPSDAGAMTSLESRFSTEECRGCAEPEGECWAKVADARRGLSHPNACQTGALAQAGAGVPVPCRSTRPQIRGAGNPVEKPPS